jgi:serine/threonine protein phosphatase 1
LQQANEQMLKKLFGDRARTPEGLRLYAIGDIHGCAGLLDRLMALIEEDAARGRSQLVFLGDYLDRGPDSRGVVERLIAIAEKRPDTVFLKGNHEAVFLDFLASPAASEDWLHWGGAETLESYGVEKPWLRPAEELAAEMLERAPADHLAFLRGLELARAFGDYFFVHAGVRPGTPLDEQDERDLLWIRGDFHHAAAAMRPDKVIVHGHQPAKKPVDAGWRIGVDTGACFSGALTAVVLEGESRRFLST